MIKKTKIFTQLVTGTLIGMIAAITLCFSSCKKKVIPTFYKVTFDTQGGSAIVHKGVKPGGFITLPPPPKKAGATFAGWYTDKEGKNSFSEKTAIKANLTLYAKWNEQLYTIAFDVKEKEVECPTISPITGVKYGNIIIFPPEPTNPFYKFCGWYVDKEAITTPFSPATPITDNITLHAKWVSSVSPVVFRLFSKTIKHGGTIPYKHVYFRDNISPQMSWVNVPKGTKSFLLIMEILAGLKPGHEQWVVYNIPADKHSLAENDPWLPEYIPPYRKGAYQGPYAGDRGFYYQFIIYALNVAPGYFNDDNYPVSSREAEARLGGHILASSNIIAKF